MNAKSIAATVIAGVLAQTAFEFWVRPQLNGENERRRQRTQPPRQGEANEPGLFGFGVF